MVWPQHLLQLTDGLSSTTPHTKNMAASVLPDQRVLVITMAFKQSNRNVHVEIDQLEGGVRATSILCVLGFGLGLGSVVLYKLYSRLAAKCRQKRENEEKAEKENVESSSPSNTTSSSVQPPAPAENHCRRRRLVHSDTCDDILLMSNRSYHPGNDLIFHSHSIDLGESLSGIPTPGSNMFASEIGEDTFESMDRLLEELQNIQCDVDGMDQRVKFLTPSERALREEYNFHHFDPSITDWEEIATNASSSSSVIISDETLGDDLIWDYHSDLVASSDDMNFILNRPVINSVPEDILEEEPICLNLSHNLSNNGSKLHIIDNDEYDDGSLNLVHTKAAETQTDNNPDLSQVCWQRNCWWQTLIQQSYNNSDNDPESQITNKLVDEHLDTVNGNHNFHSPPPSSPYKHQSKGHYGEMLHISEYVDRSIGMSYEMRKGYQMLRPLLGQERLRCVGGGVLRAALFSVLLHDAQVLYTNLVCALQRLQILLPKGSLENWVFQPDLDNKNVAETLLQCLADLFKQIEKLCSLKTSSERAKVLQQAEAPSMELLEAVKVLMYTHQAAPLYCVQMDLETFLKDKLNKWNYSTVLNKKELCLLALSLGIQLEVIWPARYGEMTFIQQYPEEVADGVPKIRLVAETDDTYHVLCMT